MTAASLLKRTPQNGLQPVDLSRHLGGIADLIELCFSADMDAGGRGLIREMQFLSRAGFLLKLLNTVPFSTPSWNLGYVWLEDGRVVGSVSTQRVMPRSAAWIVANVAVHPSHRRRGIALALMRATLDFIDSQGGREAILQVDEGNRGAIELYRRLGFGRVTTQTTWSRPGRTPPPLFERTGLDLRLRAGDEWREQFELARLVRPEGLAWGWPLRWQTFRPSLRKALDQFIAGRREEHWVARTSGRLAGSLIVRLNALEGDRLTLLVHPDFGGQLERPFLLRGLRRLGMRPHPVRVEHPSDDAAASQALQAFGFQPVRTLRWMKRDL